MSVEYKGDAFSKNPQLVIPAVKDALMARGYKASYEDAARVCELILGNGFDIVLDEERRQKANERAEAKRVYEETRERLIEELQETLTKYSVGGVGHARIPLVKALDALTDR